MPTARIYRPTHRNLARLALVLANGGLVATPSETVYGLAADALNAKACRNIFKAKGRPANDPLIVHVATLEQASEIACLSEVALKVARAFWPGPLTIILPKKRCVPSIVTSGLDSVAVRMPSHPLFLDLIRRSGCPLAAPSANPFGYVSPTTATHVRDGLGKRIAYILDGGACNIGVESTIIDLRDPAKPALLRPGAVSTKQLQVVIGRPIKARRRTIPKNTPAVAPGLLERHYSPSTPMSLAPRLSKTFLKQVPATEAVIFWTKPAGDSSPNHFGLSNRHGSLIAGARQLFGLLRKLDQGDWVHIHAELAPGKGDLADAINDRLRRAAAKR